MVVDLDWLLSGFRYDKGFLFTLIIFILIKCTNNNRYNEIENELDICMYIYDFFCLHLFYFVLLTVASPMLLSSYAVLVCCLVDKGVWCCV